MPVILAGLGFTGSRLARRLLFEGYPVFGAVRDTSRFNHLRAAGLQIAAINQGRFPPRATLIHSIPPLEEAENKELRRWICALNPQRVVYVSSTGIYGKQVEINEASRPEPTDEKGMRRMAEESWIASGAWSSLIVRSAAIYGPGRGVHASIRQGKLPRGTGGVVSRIHVEDLAAILEAAIPADSGGAWPAGDEEPCSSEEIAVWCAGYLRVASLPIYREVSIAGRRVDGSAVRNVLGVRLRYPDYRSGTIASIAEESG